MREVVARKTQLFERSTAPYGAGRSEFCVFRRETDHHSEPMQHSYPKRYV
jgi:hypothetical protein